MHQRRGRNIKYVESIEYIKEDKSTCELENGEYYIGHTGSRSTYSIKYSHTKVQVTAGTLQKIAQR